MQIIICKGRRGQAISSRGDGDEMSNRFSDIQHTDNCCSGLSYMG